MKTKLVRISERAGRILRKLADGAGLSMQAVLDEAVEEYRRKLFLRRANVAYARLRRDKSAWQAERGERRAWDRALKDDQDPE